MKIRDHQGGISVSAFASYQPDMNNFNDVIQASDEIIVLQSGTNDSVLGKSSWQNPAIQPDMFSINGWNIAPVQNDLFKYQVLYNGEQKARFVGFDTCLRYITTMMKKDMQPFKKIGETLEALKCQKK